MAELYCNTIGCIVNSNSNSQRSTVNSNSQWSTVNSKFRKKKRNVFEKIK